MIFDDYEGQTFVNQIQSNCKNNQHTEYASGHVFTHDASLSRSNYLGLVKRKLQVSSSLIRHTHDVCYLVSRGRGRSG